MKRKEMELFLRMRRWTARYIKKKRKEHFHSSFPTLLWASISRTSKSFLVKWASRVPRNYLSTSVLKCLVEKADCEVPMTSGCFLKKILLRWIPSSKISQKTIIFFCLLRLWIHHLNIFPSRQLNGLIRPVGLNTIARHVHPLPPLHKVTCTLLTTWHFLSKKRDYHHDLLNWFWNFPYTQLIYSRNNFLSTNSKLFHPLMSPPTPPQNCDILTPN